MRLKLTGRAVIGYIAVTVCNNNNNKKKSHSNNRDSFQASSFPESFGFIQSYLTFGVARKIAHQQV